MARKYRDLQERLLANSYVEDETGCWVWLGRINKAGRPQINMRINGRHRCLIAYRVSFEAFKGSIPENHTLDHLCLNTACICPDHLEPMPLGENVRRQREWEKLKRLRARADRGPGAPEIDANAGPGA